MLQLVVAAIAKAAAVVLRNNAKCRIALSLRRLD
jgi:hypothetical protein